MFKLISMHGLFYRILVHKGWKAHRVAVSLHLSRCFPTPLSNKWRQSGILFLNPLF